MSEKKEYMTPLLHSNGTGAKMLSDGYDEADVALNELEEKFGRIEFNARDYYPKGMDTWNQAVNERTVILEKIREIKEYLDAQRISIYDQIAEREARSGRRP